MMLFAVENSIILAVLGVLLLLFAFTRGGRRRSKSPNRLPVSRPASTPSSADAHHLDAPDSVARWEVTMHETARDLMGRLDSKIVIVEQLVCEAHQAAARLEAVLLRIEQAKGNTKRSESDVADPAAAIGSSTVDTAAAAESANPAEP